MFRGVSDGPRKGWIILRPLPLLFSCWLHCSRHATHLALEAEWGSSHQPMSKRNLGWRQYLYFYMVPSVRNRIHTVAVLWNWFSHGQCVTNFSIKAYIILNYYRLLTMAMLYLPSQFCRLYYIKYHCMMLFRTSYFRFGRYSHQVIVFVPFRQGTICMTANSYVWKASRLVKHTDEI